MGNGGYDALDYHIRIKFSDDLFSIIASSTMKAVATEDLSSFNLDFGAMTVSNVVVNNQPARYTHADPELTIAPATPLRKGQEFTVSVVYSGKPSTKLRLTRGFGDWNIGFFGFVAMSQPSLMFTWNPVNDHPSDKATYTIELTTKKQKQAVTNGKFVSQMINKDDTATHIYRIDVPTATYLVFLAVGDWEIVEDGKIGSVRVRHYFDVNTSPLRVAAAKETKKIVAFFAEKLIPYPFSEVGVMTATRDLVPYALETQSLVLIRTNGYEDLKNDTELVAHEMAHQWFGALVTIKNHEDIFLHEGFATYLSWVFSLERFLGTVGANYIEKKIKGYYVLAVNGVDSQCFEKKQFIEEIKYSLYSKTWSAEEVNLVLTHFFTAELSRAVRDQVIQTVSSSGISTQQLISSIERLQFNRVCLTNRQLMLAQELSGSFVQLPEPDAGRFLPPGKIFDADNLFNDGVYDRGAMTVHALRLHLGDDKFWALLRGFLEKFKFKNASNADWLEFVENFAGVKARQLQERWLFDAVAPDFPELQLFAADYKIGADFK